MWCVTSETTFIITRRNGIVTITGNTTGFDYPALEAVLTGRDTMSLALWDQMTGRAARPHPDKKEAWITDLGKNVRRFGHMYDQEIGKDEKGRWMVHSKGRQLTNVLFGKGTPK